MPSPTIFCSYIQILLLTSFRLGVLPELVSRYASHGTEAASEILFLDLSGIWAGWSWDRHSDLRRLGTGRSRF